MIRSVNILMKILESGWIEVCRGGKDRISLVPCTNGRGKMGGGGGGGGGTRGDYGMLTFSAENLRGFSNVLVLMISRMRPFRVMESF